MPNFYSFYLYLCMYNINMNYPLIFFQIVMDVDEMKDWLVNEMFYPGTLPNNDQVKCNFYMNESTYLVNIFHLYLSL